MAASDPDASDASRDLRPDPDRPSLRERLLAMPPAKRRLLGLGGLVLGVAVIAAGLGSIESGSDTYVPVGTVVSVPAAPATPP